MWLVWLLLYWSRWAIAQQVDGLRFGTRVLRPVEK